MAHSSFENKINYYCFFLAKVAEWDVGELHAENRRRIARLEFFFFPFFCTFVYLGNFGLRARSQENDLEVQRCWFWDLSIFEVPSISLLGKG